MVRRYFAYGSNMNPDRVRERGLNVLDVAGARLGGMRLAFDKTSRHHQGVGHANLVFDAHGIVEGVLYLFDDPQEILKMDPFERAPVNYSREVVEVVSSNQTLSSWTYFANPAVRQPGLLPPRSYLDHLLAGKDYLSREYYRMLETWECDERR